jgi:succinate-semialdehyde dehydrogenase/glutarate-semialdehyde dehydrogenase
VVEALADKFLTKFQAAMAALQPGDRFDKSTRLGAISTEGALVNLLQNRNPMIK